MWTRSWRRLVGCFVIDVALAAAAAEYRAGTGSAGEAKALALEDRDGRRAVIVETGFPVTAGVADVAAARLMQCCELGRAWLLLRGSGSAPTNAADAVKAASSAIAALAPAALRFDGRTLSVTTPTGDCRASLGADAALRFDSCASGETVRSPIRAGFLPVEPEHGLQHRLEATTPAYPIQVLEFGKQVTILALGGAVPPDAYRAPGRIVAANSNGDAPMPSDPRVDSAVRDLLARMK